MQYDPHDDSKPVICPACRWLGTSGQTDGEEWSPICPKCSTEVQSLKQSGLDKLRQEHALLLKGSYWKDATSEQRMERRGQIEWFFEAIGQPLK